LRTGTVSRRLPKIVIVASIIVFAAALTQDGYYIDAENPRAWSPGWGLLLFGWLGLLDGVFAWLANPLLLSAWIFSFVGKKKLALALAIPAPLFMLGFLFRDTIISSEAPTYSKITGHGTGYWLWLASACLTILGAALALINQKQSTNLTRSN
jgi:hypothetical protein